MSMTRRNVLQVAAAGAMLTGCADGRPPATEVSPAPAASKAPLARPSDAPSSAPAAVPASPPPLPRGLPAQIEHGPRNRPQVALTFHGRGEPAIATALLTEAEKAGARLTVLAVGEWLDACPQLARRVLDGGHELGNHTQTHGDICGMGAAAAAAEITGCADRLRRLTGTPGRWFRPSRTRLATPLVVRLAQEAGYEHVLSYDVDSLDFTEPGTGAVRANVARDVGPGSVVSLHFGYAGTIAALPGILDDLKRRGLRAVTTTELLT
ncbi:polysaccharide deacetylase family protein [Streptomyces sp. H10-C2]|uniref:polysaccharide deacetylase family protein n=1 Tax=unclassified Streptomyces TaxID=2593676 RepID=UPI0024BAD1F8|nr:MULTISPECIES: polysaccharide deacetylase family protein [unclassified Streptomyces]MDJ0346562.1 polysaccharide deacetylase family protein [Streptomyces sp. PH10-H1]MDJ0374182.1 polysaccharide deacetylase family protein [Streptomyces sp. H10-C2]